MPTIMENTIVSFNLAANSGADFVEFDVQVQSSHPSIPSTFYSIINKTSLMVNRHFVCYFIQVTKDGHPIIFHDDLIIYNEKVKIMD